MGWLYMRDCAPWSGPKTYLDDQFSYQAETKSSKVLASRIVGNKVYYAACEQINKASGEKEVFAIVCLIKYNPRAADGYAFGYKDMTEHWGCYEAECPELILDMLTPTTNPTALEWRNRCRSFHAKRRGRRKPSDGDMLVLRDALKFSDGHEGRRFRVVKMGRTLRYRSPETGTFYALGNLDKLEWSIIPRAQAS